MSNSAWHGPWSWITACPGNQRFKLEKLTPARVRRAFSHLLPRLCRLASVPKPCGRSPGRALWAEIETGKAVSGDQIDRVIRSEPRVVCLSPAFS
jgi:hypothetical protein